MAERGTPALTPEKHRKAVEMRLAGYSFEKIAAELDISKPTAIKWANLEVDEESIRYKRENAPSSTNERGEPQGLEIKPSPSDTEKGTAGVSA